MKHLKNQKKKKKRKNLKTQEPLSDFHCVSVFVSVCVSETHKYWDKLPFLSLIASTLILMAAVTAAVPRTDPPMVVSDSFAKDAILAWFRGEFAAANAIIDALCSHLAAAASSSDEYDAVFAAIHRRRLNWIPVIQMQKYHSIADVTLELRKVTEKKTATAEEAEAESNGGGDDEKGKVEEEVTESVGNGEGEGEAQQSHEEYESPESEITDSGTLINYN